MKTITMNYDEYFNDLRVARAQGIYARGDAIGVLREIILGMDSYNREQLSDARRKAVLLLERLENTKPEIT